MLFHSVPTTANHSTCKHRHRVTHTRGGGGYAPGPEGRGGRAVTDRADVLEERPGGHEVARVQDDGGQHVEEEDAAGEHSGGLLVDRVHDAPHDQPDADEETSLWHPDGDLVVHVEP